MLRRKSETEEWDPTEETAGDEDKNTTSNGIHLRLKTKNRTETEETPEEDLWGDEEETSEKKGRFFFFGRKAEDDEEEDDDDIDEEEEEFPSEKRRRFFPFGRKAEDDEEEDDDDEEEDEFPSEKRRRFLFFLRNGDEDEFEEEDFDDDGGERQSFAAQCRPLLCLSLFFSLALFFQECVLKVYAFGGLFDMGFVMTGLFSLSHGFLAALFASLFKGRLNRVIGFFMLLISSLWLMIQAVYYTIFSTFFTLYSFSGAGDAAEFWKAAMNGIGHTLLPLALMMIPLVLYFVLGRFLKQASRPPIWAYAAVLLFSALIQVGAVAAVYRCDDGVMSQKYLYTKTFIPSLSVKNFGAVTTFELDLKNMVFGMADTETAEAYEKEEERKRNAGNIHYEDNVLDIDFAALSESETSDTLKDMHAYFGSVTPTAQNEYTGMFEGKNLIWICAEGFSSWALDKELTPTLWKMANECFVFENYYNPIWGVSTSDGEYTVCTGLLPKSGVWSMSESGNNDMAFCMGNQLSARGYLCNAYHNHSYTYYNRDESHPNMGYDFIAKGHGLDIVTQWPESDVEMMEETVGDYTAKEPFHIYYMTVSGHLEYNFGGNAMAAKHRAEVEDLPYSDAAKAYIACQIELDDALESLIQSLSAAGVLEDTLIVLSGDHYPYGLTNDQISELNGSEVETNFELYHSTLIMWNSELAKEDPVIVEKPCYSVDILPTLSNLMGVPYDSRLLMGHDIFSTASPLVVFANHSWLTDKGRYNAVSGEFIPNDGVSVEESYAQSMMEKVNAMFTYSAKILETDYYGKVLPENFAAEAAAQAATAPANDEAQNSAENNISSP
ncbi:MAG: LTA synthase family protein [Clostridia bacterium]